MKKFLLGTVGLIALGMAPASAADLAPRPYTKAPPMVAPVYDWSGFYIGANGGWANQHSCFNAVTPAGTFLGNEGCHNADGGVVGGQIGYRWQASQWVFGLEAQGDWADLRGSNESLLFPGFTNRSRMDAFGLFTGQVGYAWNNVLFYVKGGAAVTDNRSDIIFDVANTVVGTSSNNTQWGGTVGAGLEYGFAPGWSVAVEYDHIFMNNHTTTFFVPATSTVFATDRISGDVDMVTARVNYHFNWGGPVIAKY
ncbi:outer membrane protein [Bradyrhizobium canariense]|uniref:Outer membrane immunogenic protein n=1 Tax=Bradyrhizobium canariense TaxID=255045 RepID=A0A1H1Q078_9BRAD|nr:outer membrane beta-barrel protein [Bradyrhizobium canariense]SDS16855.1 outer membrane immunogenic protein [Bradyrhizobium canariense]